MADTPRASDRPPTEAATVRARVALEYAIVGDLRYLSHHDEIRMLTRALVRSRWPLAYSRGFNPQPRLSIPLPRRTGVAADPQLALVHLSAAEALQALRDALAGAMPKNVPLRSIGWARPSASPIPQAAEFTVPVADVDRDALRRRIEHVLSESNVMVVRPATSEMPSTTVDIRPFLAGLRIDGETLHIGLRFEGQRSARPTDVLTALELDAVRLGARATRVDVKWNMTIAAEQSPAAENERNSFVQEENNA